MGLVGSPMVSSGGDETDLEQIRGVTISCQTWGKEWGEKGFADELDDLQSLGVNWVAIHPYAGISGDGSVKPIGGELDPARPPLWLSFPIQTASERRMGIMIVPHLAHWGSPFHSRGAIDFSDAQCLERFFRGYEDWIVSLAQAARAADAFCIGSELDSLLDEPDRWRELIRAVREVTPARLTYAANWDRYAEVPFWSELDAIGIQAYFPLSDEPYPRVEILRAAWEQVLAPLRELHRRTGKPVVFTEFGYHCSEDAARAPWIDTTSRTEDACALQERCLDIALSAIAPESAWLRGAFLWKWFVGEPDRNDRTFELDTPRMRMALQRAWGRFRRPRRRCGHRSACALRRADPRRGAAAPRDAFHGSAGRPPDGG